MNRKELVANVYSLFKNHKTENKVFITADGIQFFGKHHAESHASGLKDQDILEVTREMAEEAKIKGWLEEEETGEEKTEGEEKTFSGTHKKLELGDLKKEPEPQKEPEPEPQKEPSSDPPAEKRPETTKKTNNPKK